jgi:hypothetical protein
MKPDIFFLRHYIMKFYTCQKPIPESNNFFLFLLLTLYKKKFFLNTIWYNAFPITMQCNCVITRWVAYCWTIRNILVSSLKIPCWNLKPVAEIKPRLIFSAWMSLFLELMLSLSITAFYLDLFVKQIFNYCFIQ